MVGHLGVAHGIIPAYAGSTGALRSHCPVRRDHPRIRGEHAALDVEGLAALGSSPHTRGARVGRRRLHVVLEDHPRIRGEHLSNILPALPKAGSSPHTRGALGHECLEGMFFAGSSPHTRGAPRPCGAGRRRSGIIPAYAGSTSTHFFLFWSYSDHPRIRGEHRLDRLWVDDAGGSSPHTRGAPILSVVSGRWTGIIPAYAGSTRCSRPPSRS